MRILYTLTAEEKSRLAAIELDCETNKEFDPTSSSSYTISISNKDYYFVEALNVFVTGPYYGVIAQYAEKQRLHNRSFFRFTLGYWRSLIDYIRQNSL